MESQPWELFLKYNYQETKDMGLHFLTLITAVLVFSLNYAEKIIDFKSSKNLIKLIVILAWAFLLTSIIFCGLGLVYNALAGGTAVYSHSGYEYSAYRANLFIMISGLFFIFSLIFMITSTIFTLTKKQIASKKEV